MSSRAVTISVGSDCLYSKINYWDVVRKLCKYDIQIRSIGEGLFTGTDKLTKDKWVGTNVCKMHLKTI
jgi:hypothetical protein